MATLQKTLLSLIQSPKGLLAITGLLGSVVAFLYFFVFNGGNKPRSTRRQDRSGSSTKKSTPKKVSSQRKQASPASNSKNSAKTSVKSLLASKSSTTEKKSERKSDQTKPTVAATAKKGSASKTATSTSAHNNKSGVSSQGRASKADEGEWITVNKKKPRSSPSKRQIEDDTAKTPVTRSRTTRTSSALGKTPKRN